MLCLVDWVGYVVDQHDDVSTLVVNTRNRGELLLSSRVPEFHRDIGLSESEFLGFVINEGSDVVFGVERLVLVSKPGTERKMRTCPRQDSRR